MMRSPALVSLLLVCCAVPAAAEIGTIDDVPAATLLLPYFEVDLDDPDWRTTLFSVNNASAAPAIAHLTLWTDLSVPTLDFNVYLTGYDVVTFNLRDLFDEGLLPATSHDDPLVSPVGIFSLTTNPVTGVGPGSVSCDDQLPLPPLPAVLLDHIRAAHTGGPSAIFGGLCSGIDHGDNVARGYVTIDNVNFCSLQFPGDTGYWIAGGNGVGNNENQLWGDVFYIKALDNVAKGETLVHIEASDLLGAANYTFYRRYTPAGEDQREGLGTTFAARFVTGGPFSGGTSLMVWRDAKRTIVPFNCTLDFPAPYPLATDQIVVFDEQENPTVPEVPPFSPPPPAASFVPFPWEANLVQVGGPTFPVAPAVGWLYLNLNTAVAGSQVPFEPLTQNWVTVVMTADGRFGVAYDALQLGNVTDPLAAGAVILPVCDGAPDPPACG
jgi:hypothetical protein